MKPKKILIIAHFFDPCNVIASHRPKSWAIALKHAGFEPVIMTRNWTGNEKNWVDFLGENRAEQSEKIIDGLRVISVPYKKTRFHRLSSSAIARKRKLIRFTIEWVASIFGQVEPDRDVYANFYHPADKLLKEESFDLVLVTCNPNIGVKLAAKLSKNNGVPWVADFRDLWDINVQRKDPSKIPFREKVRFLFYTRYMKSWLKTARHIIVCNEMYLPYMDQVAPGIKKTLVKNGYEVGLFSQFPDTSATNPVFTIMCMGTLHIQQDKRMFSDGLKLFLARHPQAKIQVRFIGANVNPLVSTEIESLFPSDILVSTGMINREDALRELKNAHVLFYPVWPDYFGIYPGKLFEYLGSRKNILMAPNDHGLLEKTLKETQAGYMTDTSADCATRLENWYAEWERDGKLTYAGVEQAILHYTREYQSTIVVNLITHLLN